MPPQRAATIQIAENPVPRADTGAESSGRSLGGGVYSLRNLSGASLERRSTRGTGLSLERHNSQKRDPTAGEDEDEDQGLRQASDYKKRQVFTGKKLLWLAYQSTGVIYGDIGTSPLYVYSSTFAAEPSYDDLVGVLSLVLWALIMMVTVKYIIIILRADNEGEGGTFSTYSLLSRFANITKRDPREASLIKMERYRTGDLENSNRRVRSFIEKSSFLRGLLKTIGVFAVSMVISDGVLTPAQSVLGAVQGLEVVKPDISKSTIVGTTCGILVLLFLIQPLGTTKLASSFAPIVMVWLIFNAAFGIYNLIKFDYTVLKAFSPGFAFEFLIRNKTTGWRMLGGVLLAFTGVEALFADLGAFSRRAIQLSWLCFTLPCLFLAYIGQAAYISQNPGAYKNAFYNAVPPGMLYPSLVVAILAAIVASQAIITATFQLLAQIMKLSYFPQIKVVHTSTIFHGQLYVPLVNWLLMVGTVVVAAVFNNTTSLGNAYGVCVMFVTFFDTCMVSLAALIVWRVRPIYVFFPWLTIACMDGTFLSSVLTKVPQGAWFTLTLAGILAAAFILWRFGKEQQWQAEAEDRFPTSHLVNMSKHDGQAHLTDAYGGYALSPIKGFGVFFDKAGETTPMVFSQFLSKLAAAPEVMVFFHLRPLETPSVSPEARYTVTRISDVPHCYRLVVRHGYMDEVISPNLAALVYELIRDFIIKRAANKSLRAGVQPFSRIDDLEDLASAPPQTVEGDETINTSTAKPMLIDGVVPHGNKEADEAMAVQLATLQSAYDHQVLYIIGKEQMKIKPGANLWRTILLKIFLWLRENTRTKIANLRVPTDRVMEVGFVKEV